MSELNQLTYAAIITIALPGMDHPATVSVTLTPQTMVETGSGQVKPLRDCSLAELQAAADALESELWARYREDDLGKLAAGAETEVKITILDESGQSQSLEPEAWLEHAIILDQGATVPQPAVTEAVPAADKSEEVTPEHEAASDPAQETAQDGKPEETVEQAGNVQTREGDAGSGSSDEPSATEADDKPVLPEGEGNGGDARPVAPAAESVAEDDKESPVSGPDDGPSPTAKEAQATEAGTVEDKSVEPAEQQAEVEIPAPPAEESPVIPGPEPSPAPAEMRPAAAPSEIRIAGLRRPIGHPTAAAVDILINEPAFRDTQAHALSTLDREVAGMLIGPPPEKQPDGRYVVHITDAIVAKHTHMHGASVTYTPESWRHVTDVLQDRYPEEEAIIVGWYHTHPGFGIFLSGMDLFIHQNFFTQKWHVALVLDPLARKSGFFCWDRGQHAVQAYDFPWPRWASTSW